MCGIVGYIGPKAIDSVLIVGLKKLEYRGYDSAGIAILDQGELVIRKKAGKITDLEDELNNNKVGGHLGIGHTRWATHGEPTQLNAHPHYNTDEDIAIVHNGIIENYMELKKKLTRQGYIFKSDTDTEVIVHLLDFHYKQTKDYKRSFLKTIRDLEGKYAIAAIAEEEPGKIYFVRNGAPMIIARNTKSKETFLASDLPALVPIATESFYLEDGQWGILKKNEIELFAWEGDVITPEFKTIDMKIEDFDLGDYPHYMLKEIYEQPDIVKNLLTQRIKKGSQVKFDELYITPDYLKSIGRVIIQACGTSLIAGLVGKNYLEQYCQIYTDADFSSEFRYRNPVLDGDTLVIGISQSGETADTIAGIHESKAKFLKVISFLNNMNSTMARESDGVVHLMAGPEVGVASTKAYTAQLINLYLFSIYLGKIKGTLTSRQSSEMLNKLHDIPEKMTKVLNNIEPIKKIAEFLKDHSDTIFLGRTYNYPSALEGALKLKEISYIHASGYAAGEFKHGPIALVSEKMPVIVIVPKSEIRTKILSNLLEVKARKGTIISILTEGDQEIMDISDYYIEIPKVDEAISPLLTILPLQLIAYYTALYRGCNVDKPRNLAKSVTVE